MDRALMCRSLALLMLVVFIAQASAQGTPGPSASVVDVSPEAITRRVAPEIERFRVRAGWKVSLAVPVLDGARFLEFGDDGTLYVSRPRVGDIVACTDTDADGIFETMQPIVDQHESVQAMCWHDGWLWFATSGEVWKTRATAGGSRDVVRVLAELPAGGIHWWRSLLITDRHIYTSIGDSENISDQRDTDRQKIWRYSLTGGEKTLFASGVRNTEKLLLRPGTNEVWGVDHGSDWFGRQWGENDERGQPITDLNPCDEFNLYEEGKFYGHPFLTGPRVPRIEFKDHADLVRLASQTVAPQLQFGAHWAANGWCFVDPAKPGDKLPPGAGGDAFVACRGSWNRSTRAGYSVVRVLFEKDDALPASRGRPYGMQQIVSTLSADEGQDQMVLARPVDCVQAPDGSILFSSDAPRGRVYRLTWVGPATPASAPTPTAND